MMNRKLVLAVDKAGYPIDIIGYEDCFRLFVKGQATVVDTLPDEGEEYATYRYITDVDEWFNIPNLSKYKPTFTSSCSVPTPEVITLTGVSVSDLSNRTIKCSKVNLLIRDEYSCAYCGCALTRDTVTVDHVRPRAVGGRTSWSNCTSACITCNLQKADNLPIGRWKPNHRLYQPSNQDPRFNDACRKLNNLADYPDSWNGYFKKLIDIN